MDYSKPNLIDWIENREDKLVKKFAPGSEDSSVEPAYVLLSDDGAKSQSLTHRQLLKDAKALAVNIQRQVCVGDRVILFYPFGLDYITAFFACIYAGVIAVPAFPPSSRRRDWSRINTIFDNAKPALILTCDHLLDNVLQWQKQAPIAQLASVISSDNAENIKNGDANLWRRPETTSDSIAFLQYSSGSTGTPKGVMVSHANILHNLEVIAHGFSLDSSCIGASWLPIYHDMGLVGSVLQPFNMSITNYLLSPIDVLQKPVRWLQAISDYGITLSGGPNFIFEHCVNRIRDDELKNLDLSSWTLAFNGSEPIHDDTLTRFSQKFASCGFNASAHMPCYGMAETTLMVSSALRDEMYVNKKVTASSEINNSADEKGSAIAGGKQASDNRSLATQSKGKTKTLVSSGFIHPDLRVKIVHPETQVECAAQTTGEIWVHGKSVASGYWQQHELSEKTFSATLIGDEHKYLRTGDLGFIQDNNLYVNGRIKELIIIRGQNHYPQDIEASVRESCDALKTCRGAAFSYDADGVEKIVVAHEVDRHLMRQLSGETIAKNVRQALAENHQLAIDTLVLIKPASLLRTTSGKIKRVAMRQAFLDNELKELYRFNASPVREHTSHLGIVTDDELDKKHSDDTIIDDALNQSTDNQKNNQKNENINRDFLSHWLKHWIANRLSLVERDIDLSQDFISFGLDSVDAVELTHDLNAQFTVEAQADMAWVYPNAELALDYVMTLIEEEPRSSSNKSDGAKSATQVNRDEQDINKQEQSSHSDDAKWLVGEL